MITSLRLKHLYWDLRRELRSLRFEDLALITSVRHAGALRDYFRRGISVEEAQEAIARAMDRRGENFLALVETEVYGRSVSPYNRLLRNAGCEYSDLQALVRRDGLEGSLAELARAGVYLSAAEFKGKTDVVRGNLRFRVSPADLARRDRSPGLSVQSSGTSNRPQTGHVALDWLSIWTYSKAIFLEAHDLLSNSHAVYDAILPAPAAIYSLMHNARIGLHTERWFAQRMPHNNWVTDAETLWSTYLTVLMGRLYGPGFPRPEFLRPREFQPVFDWLAAKRGRGQAACIDITASNAVRMAQEASRRGVSLEGTTFILHGEPFTDAKRAIIQRSAARCTTRYSFSVGMNVGHGCANPAHIDEIHVNQYMLAVIPRPHPLTTAGPAIHPLLFTSLYPQAALLHLNVENGDYAKLEQRDCGCALQKAGLTTHLYRIRSYEKFVSEGWTYFFTDLYELVERTLPNEFGGGPGDYQLVEEEGDDGLTRLYLVVDPAVGPLDEARLMSRLEKELIRSPNGNWNVATAWIGTKTLGIRRAVPHASPRGKILPLHIPH